MSVLPENPITGIDAVDTHAHVFHRALPMMPNRRYTPGYDASIDEYARVLDAHSMLKGVLVQPSFLGVDNQFLLDGLHATDGRFRGVVVVDPSISVKQLDAMNDIGVTGIRLNLLGVEMPRFQNAQWRCLFDRVNRLGWHVEIQCPASGLPSILPALLRRCQRIVIDHFGLPDFKNENQPGVLDYLCSQARTGRVWVKLSAPYRVWAAQTMDGSVAIAQALLDAFTADRLIWGSDWPHTGYEQNMSYETCLGWLGRWVGRERDVFRILSSTPKELFNF